jgi:hypothetical protein
VPALFVLASPAGGQAPTGEWLRVRPLAAFAAPRAWAAAKLPRPARPTRGFLVARLAGRSGTALRARPHGAVVARLTRRTEFGSPQTLAVVRRRGKRWLGVLSPMLGNGRLGWIDAQRTRLRFFRVRIRLDVDLSRRHLELRIGDSVVRRLTVSIGRAGSSTPTGRFAVTDKLAGPQFGAYYGCCILALSGRQPNLPAGWRGGDRLAIHGTPNPSSLGGAVSAGCLHASRNDLIFLMRRVPLGTQVVIHR